MVGYRCSSEVKLFLPESMVQGPEAGSTGCDFLKVGAVEMLRFCGFDIELTVDTVLERHDDRSAVFSATDGDGEHWLIVEDATDEKVISWICAPASDRVVELVASGRAAATDALCHSRTGWVEVVRVVDGHAVPDQRVACAELAGLAAPPHLAPV
jgi:hypothetical protein